MQDVLHTRDGMNGVAESFPRANSARVCLFSGLWDGGISPD